MTDIDLTDIQKRNRIEFLENRITHVKREIAGMEQEIILIQESMD